MKNYLMEFAGTLLLTLALLLAGNVLAVGLVLVALVYVGAHVSGAYFNPALTVAGWANGSLKREHALWYILAQVAGAVGAVVLVSYGLGRTPSVSNAQGGWWPFVLELLLTYLFASLYLTVFKSNSLKNNDVYGLAIGLSYAGLLFFGSLYNPAIPLASWLAGLTKTGSLDLGPWLVVGVIAPLVGGLLASYSHSYHHSDRK